MKVDKEVQSGEVADVECRVNGHRFRQMWILDSLAGKTNKQGAFCTKCGLSLEEVRGEADEQK